MGRGSERERERAHAQAKPSMVLAGASVAHHAHELAGRRGAGANPIGTSTGCWGRNPRRAPAPASGRSQGGPPASAAVWPRGDEATQTDGERARGYIEREQEDRGRARKGTEGERAKRQIESEQGDRGRASKGTEGERARGQMESEQGDRGRASKETDGERARSANVLISIGSWARKTTRAV